MQQYCYRCKSN